jgi:hypothetical protein
MGFNLGLKVLKFMVIELLHLTIFYPPSTLDVINLVSIGMDGWMDG